MAVKAPHVEWVKEGFQKGLFLLAGPKSGKLGGLILVKTMSQSEIEAFVEKDPYVTEKVAMVEIIPFNIALTAPTLEGLKA